jgi:peptidoglycan-N-acetylglucosamine deacetylase
MEPRKSRLNGRYFRRIALLGALGIGLWHGKTPLSAHANLPGIIYWHGDAGEKKIALTFDDGPNEPYTSEILAVLRQERVRATFFMVGENVERYPDTAREIVREGHAIGNHSYSHSNLVFDTNKRVRSEILRTEDAIAAITGERPTLFRAPFGDKDFLTIHQARRLGYTMIQWSVTAQDWRRPGVERICRNVLRHAHPGGIVLMHDGDEGRHGSDRSQTVAALPILIRELRAQGYEFVTVPEILKLPSGS